MKIKPVVLKERLKNLIDGNQVKAALFYTFNFEPKFFENYVMPLLVPDQVFLNNNIGNNIIWRKLYKDNLVPPISVYYDQYAKSLEHAPMLDYKVVGVDMPSVGKNKGNFHPKHSFILVKKQNGQEYLVVLTGSNNLSQGGWCENLECISEVVLDNNAYFPFPLKQDLRKFINNISTMYGKRSDAENLITSYLNKQKTSDNNNLTYYNSLQGSFPTFLKENIFNIDTISEIEIISPYFKNDTQLITFFIEHGVNMIKIEAPFKDDYCLMEKELFESYMAAGVNWYKPAYFAHSDEPRNVHSKVYRLYGNKYVFTIIGSVNFTAPAWAGLPQGKKQVYNMESAVMYTTRNDESRFLKQVVNIDMVKFLGGAKDPEIFQERIESPMIQFTINWSTNILSWKPLVAGCILYFTADVTIELGSSTFVALKELKHADSIITAIAQNSLLHVKDEKGNDHYYYPNQEGFEHKPLEYRFSATDILQVWQLLGEEHEVIESWLLNRLEVLTELVQDENGILIKDASENKSLLNEMAQHLHGISQLEKHLFKKPGTNKQLRKNQFSNIKYYLTHDNVDTLVSYLRDIEKSYKEKKLLGGYYWLMLNIIQSNFYEYKPLKKLLQALCEDKELLKKTGQDILQQSEMLSTIINELEKEISISKTKLAWAKETLELDYENVG